MSDAVLIVTTIGSIEEAELIASALIEQRLAACVQMLPVTSIYRWEGKVERAGEVALHIKTRAANVPLVEARIVALHSYDLPEFIVLPISSGSSRYLSWLAGASAGEE